MKDQHAIYILAVFLLNTLLVVCSYVSPFGTIAIFTVGITHMRDTVFVMIRLLFKPFVVQALDNETYEVRTVLCVLPVYKEEMKVLSGGGRRLYKWTFKSTW